MKKYLTFLLAAVLLLTLTACGASAAADSEAELAACRAAMEQLQSGSYHIATRRDFLDDHTQIEFEHWKHGEDWMGLSKHKNIDTFFATLSCDGQAFVNMGNTEMDWLKNIRWNPCPDTALQVPLWLENCRWEDQEVRLLDADGKTVTVQFLTPYRIGDQTAQGYAVEFHFDRKGELKKAVMAAVFQNSNGGEDRWVDEMTILSSNSEEVAAKIETEYQRALEQNK